VVARYLEGNGCQIVARNFEVRVRGRSGGRRAAEVDLVAWDEGVLVFVEVKTRKADGLLPIEASVDATKRLLISMAARRWRAVMRLHHVPYRFDVVVVRVDEDERPQVRHLRGAFREVRRVGESAER
jgi:putative endonuclease